METQCAKSLLALAKVAATIEASLTPTEPHMDPPPKILCQPAHNVDARKPVGSGVSPPCVPAVRKECAG